MASLIALTGCGVAARRHNVLGREAFESGQLSRAINEFQLALQNDPRNSDAYHNLATTYWALGRQANNSQWVDQAEQLYRQSISLDPTNVDAHRSLAVLLAQTNRSQYALDLLQGWQQRQPNSPEPLVELARLQMEMGDMNRASNHLADALRIDAYHPRALRAMGFVRESQGQWAMALENYSRSYQADSRQAELVPKMQALQTRLATAPSGYRY
ncbi:MAG TPA: tetratricopeptide repeat protein [Pirellulaceae bacterium]|nr:tetratricopeptide repeat protein [Pirellulaceae bacterium]